MTRNDGTTEELPPGLRRSRGASVVVIALLVILAVTAPAPASSSDAATFSRSADAGPGTASRVLWTGDMEEGSLADWDVAGTGGVFNSGAAGAVATSDLARSGEWSAELTATAPPESGARLFRWGESRSNRDLYYEAWFYLPVEYQLTGDPDTGRYWNIFQFKSTSEDGNQNDPLWFLNVTSGPDGGMVPEVVWWSNSLEGPREGESGSQGYVSEDVTLPVGRWFSIKARLRQSKDFDGLVQFWVDGQKIFDMRDVRTGYANCEYNDWCVDQGWSVNLYSDGLSPAPSVMYVDDARIRRPGRCRVGPGGSESEQ